MNLLRELAGGLFKMFVGDVWLSIGIVLVVALAAALIHSGAVMPVVSGAILFGGCILVLVAAIALSARRSAPR